MCARFIQSFSLVLLDDFIHIVHLPIPIQFIHLPAHCRLKDVP